MRGISVQAHALTRTYRRGSEDVHALLDVTLAIPRSAIVVVLGPSGSGKSTLLNLLGGIDRPTSGHLVVEDLMSQVVVFNPLIEDPVFVGEDVVNGVQVRTYTFEVRSVGAATEVEAARAHGSYAVADDGDYLVHYRLDMDLRTGPEGDPETESTVFFIELSLEDINQPATIAFPSDCQVAEPGGG